MKFLLRDAAQAAKPGGTCETSVKLRMEKAKITKTTLLLMFLFSAGIVKADEFTLEPFSIVAGETKTVTIHLDGSRPYINFQLDLYLPVGFSIEEDADGELLWDVNADMKNEDHYANGRKLADAEGHYRVIVASPKNRPFKNVSGNVLDIPLVAAEDVEPGEYVIRITNQKLTSEELLGYCLDDKECPFSVVGSEDGLVGDVNGDGSVDIADVTALVNVLTSGEKTESADVNGDGTTSVDDIPALVSIILGTACE